MKRWAVLATLTLAGCALYGVISDPSAFFAGIVDTLVVWLYKVYPAIFTFFMLASLLINTRVIDRIIYYLNPVLKNLRFPNEESLHIFILSIFTGNPASAVIIGEAVNKNKISINDGNELLKYASFLNPLFIISFWMPHNIKYALILVFVHIAGNFLIAIFENRGNPKTKALKKPITFSLNELFNSLNKIIGILLMIASVMTAANIIYYSLNNILSLLNQSSTATHIILANIEISVGLNNVASLNLPKNATLLIFAFLTGFAGLSIHMQVYNVTNEYNLRYAVFFKYRLLQGAVSTLLLAPFIALS